MFALIALAAGSAHARWCALATADTEGHVNPCRSCPAKVGLGGMARRATLVTAARAREPKLLLIDAGNFLFGPDSFDTRGEVIVAAYGAMKYDAVNLSYRDFRLGMPRTMELLRGAAFDAVSANLLDERTGKPLARPYVVKRDADGRRIAILGLTDPPAGWEQVRELKQQLAGVRIVPSQQALAEWLPKAAAESDRIILLYYGSAAGLARVRADAGNRVSSIAVGGAMDVEDLPGAVPVAAPEKHGKSIAELTWPDTGPALLREISVSPDVPPDPRMQRLLADYATNAPGRAPVATTQSAHAARAMGPE